jgi:hypothetical protein
VTTTTTTKKATRNKPGEPVPTFEQLAEQKVRDAIEAYRAAVQRAADGEVLMPDAMEKVLKQLETMNLPELCWSRDVKALLDYRTISKAAEKADADRPRIEAEAREQTDRIAKLEEELRQARGRRFECTELAASRYVELLRRIAELETMHPHLLGPVDAAVKHRQDEKAKAAAKQVPKMALTGWST